MKKKVHHDFRCADCKTPNAAWGISGVEYCSTCLPADAITQFTSTMTPKASVRFKTMLRGKGNKALAAREKTFHDSLPLLEKTNE